MGVPTIEEPIIRTARTLSVLTLLLLVLGTVSAGAPVTAGPDSDPASYWTAERVASAIPRDMVIDDRGLGYLRLPTGELRPYGHSIPAKERGLLSVPLPMAKPDKGPGGGGGGGSDTTPPEVSDLNPNSGSTIGASYTFSAVVTDDVGVKSVTMYVGPAGGAYQSFAMSNSFDDTWRTALEGFTSGEWEWYVVAKDTAKRGGNTTTSDPVGFTVDTGGTTPPTSDVVTNAEWNGGGTVDTAVGRLLFQMPANRSLAKWDWYVCSGTVVDDGNTYDNRSIVLTAAHCVYDDVYKVFARNVIFIPDQDGTTGAGTDLNCDNDPLGCWTASAGVVGVDWTTRTFPDNVAWDYAYYVFPDREISEAFPNVSLESAAGHLSQSFAAVGTTMTHALGYSYSDDPNLMYCAEDLSVLDSANYWLDNCGLSGGSSGGPWLQPGSDGEGPIISVNSWGYTTEPGMAGPKLDETSAFCVFSAALTAEGDTKTC